MGILEKHGCPKPSGTALCTSVESVQWCLERDIQVLNMYYLRDICEKDCSNLLKELMRRGAKFTKETLNVAINSCASGCFRTLDPVTVDGWDPDQLIHPRREKARLVHIIHYKGGDS